MSSHVTPSARLVDRLAVQIHATRLALGQAAAREVAVYLQKTIRETGQARVIFACAPSQDEFLDALSAPSVGGITIDWSKVTAFHMDDYVGLPGTDARTFRYYLQQHLLSRVKVARFHPLKAEGPDSLAVAAEYEALLKERPIDLICLGIGENGHIAFNDPPVADFNDPRLVKRVELDHACRTQQVNDGCFPTLADVPRYALTLTIPVFRQAKCLSIQVPGPRKARAVRATLYGPISPECPASILREHPKATLHLDLASAADLPPA